MIDIDSAAFKRYSVVVAILFFAVPGVLVISYMFVRGFLPSPMLGAWIAPFATIFGIAIFSVAMPAITVGARSSGKRAQLLLIPLAPLFGALIGVQVLGGPLPYLLHVGSNSKPVTTLETVTHLYVRSGRRNFCPRKVTFAGDRLVFRRRICRVSETTFRALKVGDVLELHGPASQFGMLVTSYRIPAEG